MALNSLLCAVVPLRTYTLTLFSQLLYRVPWSDQWLCWRLPVELGRKLSLHGDDRQASFLLPPLSILIQRFNAILLHDRRGAVSYLGALDGVGGSLKCAPVDAETPDVFADLGVDSSDHCGR